MSQQIVILAAGKGTRMGAEVPKVLLPLHDKPVIAYLLDEISDTPQDTAPIIVVGFKAELVKETLGDEYIYVTQFDQKGTAHAVRSAKDAVIAENFIVLYGDMPFIRKESLAKLIDLHNTNQAKLSMFTAVLPNFENQFAHFLSFGRIIRDEDGEIIKIQEYKDCSDEQKEITEVNPGIYMFQSSWLWDKLAQIRDHNTQHEFYLTDIVELAIKDGATVYSLSITPEEVYGINNPDDLEFARNLI
jgi:bifunctional UDP-N-acetylglucosamine pyrophosphorylase / glucosamine-1-phosphate N-acetyltransferase